MLRRGGWLLVSDVYGRDGASSLRGLIVEHEFDIVAWEDHSGLLARLIWDIVERHGSMAAFWRAAGMAELPTGQEFSGLGYFLCVARRGDGGASDNMREAR